MCKYELQSVDRCVATNVPNVFFKFKQVQMKSVMAKKSLLMCRCKRKGKDICAHGVSDNDERAKIVRLNGGYYIFKDVRDSPAYLAKKKKEAFAMICQLKIPALFISQSASETKWPELLRALGQTVIFSKCKPIGEITDYFWRKEFATRGAIHVHWFAYVKDAPVYSEVPNSEIAEFYDRIISCSSEVPEDHKENIQYQIHRHSKSCSVGKARSCRFGFPKPLMD